LNGRRNFIYAHFRILKGAGRHASQDHPMFGHPKIHRLSAAEVRDRLDRGQILLIDVREPAEYAAERIHGALNHPLSTFDPRALPDYGGRKVVFQCGSGKRSATAVDRCRAAGLHIDSHLAGGIAAWRGAGFPTVALDATTGAVADRR
jgi:rhodanese-related sulfurtransferase